MIYVYVKFYIINSSYNNNINYHANKFKYSNNNNNIKFLIILTWINIS